MFLASSQVMSRLMVWDAVGTSAETKAAYPVRLIVTTDVPDCQKPPGESRTALGVHYGIDRENIFLLGSLSKGYGL